MKPEIIITVFLLIALYMLCGCAAYDRTPYWFPNSWNTTYSVDQTGVQTYYIGVSGPLKRNQ